MPSASRKRPRPTKRERSLRRNTSGSWTPDGPSGLSTRNVFELDIARLEAHDERPIFDTLELWDHATGRNHENKIIRNRPRANSGGKQIMARPVKETPILTGKDAKQFTAAIKANEKKTITPDEHKRIMDAWRKFQLPSSEK